jgi:hypothetical protein
MTNGQPPAPVHVRDVVHYWTKQPPEPTARLAWWLAHIDKGWRPNGRIQALGYHEAAVYYGVYLWEWLNVLAPRLEALTPLAAAAVLVRPR